MATTRNTVDPTKNPAVTLLIKLGSIAVHVDELLSPDGRNIDKLALEPLLRDPEVTAWLQQMDRLAYLPVKRMRKG